MAWEGVLEVFTGQCVWPLCLCDVEAEKERALSLQVKYHGLA